MYLILLLLGLIATLAGAGALAFGIQNVGFEVGTTAIGAGTTAVMGGLLLIALAQAVRQLRRIAEGLAVRADGRLAARESVEPAAAGPRAAPSRIPFPPKPELRPRPAAVVAAAAGAAVPAMEPRLEVAPRLDAPEEALDQPAPVFAAAEPEPRGVPEREGEEAPPLSPRFTARPDRDKDDELSEGLLATAFSRLDVALRRGAEPGEPSRQMGFEAPSPDVRNEPEFEPELPVPPPEAAAPEPEPEPEVPPQEEEPREEPYAVSILKSGVVDGMAYTLYSDGSIEAEMPQGTMRFASIVELRAYLEKSSS